MRIGVFTGSFPIQSETFILNHIDGLIRRGHDVRVCSFQRGDHVTHSRAQSADVAKVVQYAPRPTRNPARRLGQGIRLALATAARRPGMLLRAVNVPRHGRHAAALNLLREASMFLDPDEASFDILHAHYGPVGLRAARLLDIDAIRGKLVVTFHGYDALVVPRESGQDTYAHLFERAAAITSGSEFMRERLLDLGAPPDRTIVVPIGIDLDAFSPDDEPRPNLAKTRLLSVARLIEAKGIHVALKAVSQLKESGVNVTYTVVGDGPFRGQLETLADDLGISDLVSFTGAQSEEEIQEAYRSADIFLHPAIRGDDGWIEGQGLVLAEAQATKLPVVASKSGGIPESMRDGITGYLVPEGDYQEMAARVEFLVKHPREGMAMGEAGREFTEARFNLDSYLSRLEAVYTGLSAQ